jgi:tetratricopeptide (TPR) repeat protein
MPQALRCIEPLPEPNPDADIEALLGRAKHLAAQGKNDQAFSSYVELLRRLPTHLSALHELGRLAHRCGYRSAARTTYEQLVSHHPLNTVGRVNLGTLLYDDGDLEGARLQFEAALAIDGALRDPHRGLARIAQDLGDNQAADAHWRQSFKGQAIATQPCRGQNQPEPLLMLVSTNGGNIPTQYILDDRVHAVNALYAEYYRPDLPLPSHSLVFNTIGDADRCTQALEMAQAIVARSGKPVINHPENVRKTARAINAQRLSGVAGVCAPRMRQFQRNQTNELCGLTFPLLLRAPGFHTGQHFLKVETQEELTPAIATLPGDELLAIEFLDARGSDGLVRKYRTMCIGGAFYPLHLAISKDWKVHYFSADMQISDAHRAEERRFLENMADVLGERAMNALHHVNEVLGLEYAGIDFALDADGSLLLFEANATMLINPPGADPIWDYRRNPAAHALKAAQKLLACQ